MAIAEKKSPPAERQAVRITDWLPFIVLAVLTALLYSTALRWWYIEWTASGSYYAHGIFIPFFVALMIWRDREHLRRLPIRRAWSGLILVFLAFAIVMYAQRVGSRITLSFSFILFLIGSGLIMAGRPITKALLFPTVFLFTMIPLLPDPLINVVAFPIQLVSAKIAAGVLNLIGFEASRTGTTITMENYTLAVELPCSGFKTLLGLLSFAAAFAYVVEGAPWKRWLLFAFAAPLSLVVNGTRITLIGIVGELFSSAAAQTFHDYSGFIVLILGFTILFSMARWLRCDRFLNIELQDAPSTGAEGATAKPSAAMPASPDYDALYGPARPGALRQLRGGAYVMIGLVAVAWVVRGFVRMPPPPDPATWLHAEEVKKTLDHGRWVMSSERPIDPNVQQELKPLIWIDRDYSGGAGQLGYLHLLINGGTNRGTFHDPHDCFPASGYELRDIGPETISTPVGPVTVQVSEATNRKDRTTTLLMFLYVMDGDQLQTTRDFRYHLITRSLLGDRGHPAYFIRFRQYNTGNGPERREEMRQFIRSVWNCIGRKVTEGKRAESSTAFR